MSPIFFRTLIIAFSTFMVSQHAFSWLETDGHVEKMIAWESDVLVAFEVGGHRCGVPTSESVLLSQVMLAYATKSKVKAICYENVITSPGMEDYRKLHKIYLW